MSTYTNSPYKNIPDELLFEYTMGGKIPVLDWWLDGSKKEGVSWDDDIINRDIALFTPENIKNNKEGSSSYGHNVCVNLLKSFEKYDLRNKNIAVIGSEDPWIEAILFNLNNKITTIEYNVPDSHYEKIDCKDYFTFFENNDIPFDAIVSFSSIEHSGLGRYGDPLDPNGDLKTMDAIHKNLKEDGILIWGSPVGKDALSWNVHRVYGKLRLPILFNKFTELEWFGCNKTVLLNRPLQTNGYQPVVALRRI
jgi:hypothetical protein